MQRILARFWGKTRWPRAKLKEITKSNHGHSLGLYRAKETRFAGKFLELSRALKLKADLKQVVVSKEYEEKRYGSSKRDVERETAQDDDGTNDESPAPASDVDDVAALILDEGGFWKNVKDILSIAVPIIQVLRLTDNQDKEIIGKIYQKMFAIDKKLQDSSVSWASKAQQIHTDRWEYLHSPMHSAGYSLDPESLWLQGEKDEATQEGFLTVVERLCLWQEIRASSDTNTAAKELTIESQPVVDRIARCMSQYARVRAQDGVFSKPYVVQNARTMPPSEWWATYGAHVPDIQSIAMAVLKQPTAACAAERNWSVYGQIKSDRRARMRHDVADKRVFCHETLHYMEKLQSATYQQSVEEWSDSDSDVDFDDLL